MLMSRIFRYSERRLPESVHNELVALLMAGRLPIVVMAATIAMITVLVQFDTPDRLVPVLGAGILALLTARYILISWFRQEASSEGMSGDRSRAFERRYGIILYVYGALLGLFNFRICTIGTEATHLLLVGEIFGFAAGQVSRGSVRPRMCAGTILLATLPTAAGMFIAAGHTTDGAQAYSYAGIGVLIAIYSFSSLETVTYLYRNTLAQLITKRDLSSLARLDPLTQLPNRLMMKERLDREFESKNPDHKTALHLIDLDGFKAVNDRHGHPAGDALLRAVADRIAKAIRAGDMAVRLGGDEFAIVQSSFSSRDEVNMLARRLLRVISQPYPGGEDQLHVGASIGIALASDGAENWEELMDRADSALYGAKNAGRGGVRFWQPATRAEATRAA